MKTFKTKDDDTELEWSISINTTSAKRVKDLCGGFDLLTENFGAVHEALAADTYLLVNVIYCLVKPQADERKISDEKFGELLHDGDIIDTATEAVMEELVSFSRSPLRPAKRRALERAAEVARKVGAQALAKIDAVDVDGEIQRAFGSSSTGSPESLVSIPVPSHSENSTG